MAGAPTPPPLTEVEPDIQGARHLDLVIAAIRLEIADIKALADA